LVKEKGKEGLIFVDSNVFVIDLRYKKDKNYTLNKSFLDYLYHAKTGITSVFNILEICGILSFNLNESQLLELYHYLPDKYNIQLIPSSLVELSLPQLLIGKVLNVITRKVGLGDALIISVIENYAPHITHFISWNAVHFRNKIRASTPPGILTPEEFLLFNDRG
jgi:hypothetical protein